MTTKPTIFDVSKYIFNELQKPPPITQMRLYKLLWFCQGWHCGILEKPLFEEEFEAWRYGPVSRDLWNIFKGKIDLFEEDFEKIKGEPKNIIGDSKQIVDKVLSVYGTNSASDLMKQSHACKPWLDHKNEPGRGGIIPLLDITEYFGQFVRKENNGSLA